MNNGGVREADALVIGGGILGCAAAYYLAKRGAQVALVEKGELAAEATGASTAGITLQYRTPERLPFYQEAARYWARLEDELNADLGYKRCGSLTVTHTPDEFAQRTAEVRQLRALGLKVEMLSAAETKKIAPWISRDLSGSSFCPEDGFAEATLAPKAYAAGTQRLGGTVLSNCPVESLRRDGERGFRAITPRGEITARVVVNAAGAWAGKVAEMLGVTLPVTMDPLHGLATESTPQWMDKIVLHVSRKLTVKQMRGGRVIIGGGWMAVGDLDGGPRALLPENRETNLSMAYAAVPRLAELRLESSWVGLEGRSPDRYPLFGEVAAAPGFYILACVHGGFTLGPLLGDQLAELIVEGRTSFDMGQYTCREFQEWIARKVAEV